MERSLDFVNVGRAILLVVKHFHVEHVFKHHNIDAEGGYSISKVERSNLFLSICNSPRLK